MDGPNGTVGHAEIEIDGSVLMLADEFPDMGYRSPQSIGGTPVSLHLYVQEVDDCFNRAVAAGAKAMRPVQDQFYGDSIRQIVDDFLTMPAAVKERLKRAIKR